MFVFLTKLKTHCESTVSLYVIIANYFIFSAELISKKAANSLYRKNVEKAEFEIMLTAIDTNAIRSTWDRPMLSPTPAPRSGPFD